MNWDDLRFFLAVARQRTLLQAGKQLGVNHSTVSRRIHALQEDTGSRLFDRNPDGWVLTAAGEELLAIATRVESEFAAVDRTVLGQDARLSGPLRVTTIDMLAIYHADVFGSFADRYPDVELELSVDNTPRSLTKREADVALRMTNAPPEYLVGRKILRHEFAVYGARELVNTMDGEDLESIPWLAWDERVGARLTREWMQKNVPGARIACRVDTSTVMFACVAAGIGITFLPCAYGDTHPELRRIREPEDGFGMDLWLLTHPDLRATARVRAFMGHVVERMVPLPSEFSVAP